MGFSRMGSDASDRPSDRPEKRLRGLLEHAGWLRGLARSLVADEASADDLVQDTWVAALRRPPRDAPRPWLARVVRNAARQRARGEGRRRGREERAAGSGELPSAAELAQRLELQRALVDDVLRLDEPYRSTVVLRYYEGLSAAEIARRRGIAAATVRSHLKRALDELRRVLDARHGGRREAWSSLLVPLVPADPIVPVPEGGKPTGSSPFVEGVEGVEGVEAIEGVLAMSTGAKLATAAVVVVAVALVGRELIRPEGEVLRPAGTERSDPASAALSVASEQPEVAPTPAAADPARELVAAAEVPAAAAAEPAAPAEHGVHVVATIVDHEARPIAGALFALRWWGDRPEATSDAEGRARLDITGKLDWKGEPARVPFEVSARGRATRILVHPVVPGDNDLGTIELQPGGRLVGRVVDEADLPVAGARVLTRDSLLFHPDEATIRRGGPYPNVGMGPILETVSQADGSFVLESVPAGWLRVWARAPGTLWTLTDAIELGPGAERADLVLRLERAAPEEFVAGRLVSPTGRPVADAFVACTYHGLGGDFPRYERTDADGLFRFLALGDRPHDLHAHDPDGRWPKVTARAVAAGVHVTLRFGERRTIRLHVVDADGEPIESVAAEVSIDEPREHGAMPHRDEESPDVLVFEEPAEPFVIAARAPGFSSEEVGPFAPGELAEDFELRLTALPGLRGRVLAGGRPAAGARVTLFHATAADRVIAKEGFFSRVMPFGEVQTRADAQGRFALTPREARDYLLRAELDGWAPADLRVDGFDPAVGRADVELVLPAGGAIEGVVRGGGEIAGTVVGVSRGDGHVSRQEVGADGRFRFEGLAPGRWDVEAIDLAHERRGSSWSFATHDDFELPWDCEVFEGETTFHDLDLAPKSACVVRGELFVNGAPAERWTARLRLRYSRGRATDATTGEVGANGSFELELADEGPATLRFGPPDGSGVDVGVDLVLTDGVTEWSLALDTGRLEVGNVPATQAWSRAPHLLWKGPRGAWAMQVLQPDAAGRCVLDGAPAGEVRLVRFPVTEGGWSHDSPHEVLATVLVPAGGTARIDLP